MKITRTGARKDSVTRSIDLPKLKVKFDHDHDSQEVCLKGSDILDFYGKSHHDYDIHLSLMEVGKILEAVSNQSNENRDETAKALGPYVRHLIRLTNTCVNNG